MQAVIRQTRAGVRLNLLNTMHTLYWRADMIILSAQHVISMVNTAILHQIVFHAIVMIIMERPFQGIKRTIFQLIVMNVTLQIQAGNLRNIQSTMSFFHLRLDMKVWNAFNATRMGHLKMSQMNVYHVIK